jgi:hypothetical protein
VLTKAVLTSSCVQANQKHRHRSIRRAAPRLKALSRPSDWVLRWQKAFKVGRPEISSRLLQVANAFAWLEACEGHLSGFAPLYMVNQAPISPQQTVAADPPASGCTFLGVLANSRAAWHTMLCIYSASFIVTNCRCIAVGCSGQAVTAAQQVLPHKLYLFDPLQQQQTWQ